jgi:SNF2 family DNA or RNA helicase
MECLGTHGTSLMTVSLSSIQSVDDYIAGFVPQLTARLNTELQPLFDPARDPWDARLGTFGRPPFRAQGDAIMGIVRTLRRQNFALLVGECGVGKTLMGTGVPYVLFGNRYRVLIMCPGHLLEKWAREIVETVPDSTVRIIWKLSDLLPFKNEKAKPKGREYFIVARDRAKLGYRRKAACWLRRRPYQKPPRGEEFDTNTYPACPQCGEFLIDKKTRSPLHVEDLEARARFCEKCGEALWEADRTGVRRYPPAEFVKRHLKGFFNLLIADEVHELKGGDTAQGNALGMLASACRKTICLTGTLVGGYAEHLFFILYRINPAGMIRENLKYSQVQQFVARYGTLEYIRKTALRGPGLVYSRGSKSRETIKHRPGISPLAFARHLLGCTVFVELPDVADHLPAFGEDVCAVEMTKEQDEAYRELEGKLKSAMKDRSKAFRLRGTYLTALLSYPDRPFETRELPEVGRPKELPKDVVYPKEQALVKFVKAELASHRRTWVYATFTNRLDVTARLQQIFKKEGIKAAVLRQDTVDMHEREAWVAEQVKAKVDVIISNPELVKTGLDLIAFPALAFFQTGYNTFTLMQASRRSWRIGQAETVRVRYFFYEHTLQEAALRLMGAKVRASQALQGKFSAEGLVALTQGEDMMTALAKALVNGIEGVDSAEKYWRSERQAGRIFATPGLARPIRAKEPVVSVEETWTTLDLFAGLADFAAATEQESAMAPGQLPLELAL